MLSIGELIVKFVGDIRNKVFDFLRHCCSIFLLIADIFISVDSIINTQYKVQKRKDSIYFSYFQDKPKLFSLFDAIQVIVSFLEINPSQQCVQTLIIIYYRRLILAYSMPREPYDEVQQRLDEYNRYEDTFDVFLNIIIKRSPTIFILINMTLMIWLVQTIISSNLQSIPRSIYFFVPFLEARGIKSIELTTNKNCPPKFEILNLKNFPTIEEEHLGDKNLTVWRQDSLKFCIEKFQGSHNFSRECHKSQLYCNGFCVKNHSQCPITGIKYIQSGREIPKGYKIQHKLQNHTQYAIQRKNQSKFIVGIQAMYEKRCLNDSSLSDKYKTFQDYWSSTEQCGEEGSISKNIYRIFDGIQTSEFLQLNGIMGPFIQEAVKNQQTYLGYINLIGFKKQTQKCEHAQKLSRHLNDYLVENPVAPSFTQSLLVVCFIFFTGCWAWLLGYYCFDGRKRQKNMIVVLMSIIELIVVAFIYSQNRNLFETEKVVRGISECFEDPEIRDMAKWQFGISSSAPFLTIIYLCTCFLSLQLLCNLIDKCLYEPFYQASSHAHIN